MSEAKPCDCIVKTKAGGYCVQDCDCGNTGDLITAAEWCADRNAERALSTPPTCATCKHWELRGEIFGGRPVRMCEVVADVLNLPAQLECDAAQTPADFACNRHEVK